MRLPELKAAWPSASEASDVPSATSPEPIDRAWVRPSSRPAQIDRTVPSTASAGADAMAAAQCCAAAASSWPGTTSVTRPMSMAFCAEMRS